MRPSREFVALVSKDRPTTTSPGDMWLCRRLGIVRVFTGHKRGQSKRRGLTSFHLYHFKEPTLRARPCDWRDEDNNAYLVDQFKPDGERWEFVGNIFAMLPYERLAP